MHRKVSLKSIATEQSEGWYTTSMRHQVKRIDIGQSGGWYNNITVHCTMRQEGKRIVTEKVRVGTLAVCLIKLKYSYWKIVG